MKMNKNHMCRIKIHGLLGNHSKDEQQWVWDNFRTMLGAYKLVGSIIF